MVTKLALGLFMVAVTDSETERTNVLLLGIVASCREIQHLEMELWFCNARPSCIHSVSYISTVA